MSDPLILIKRHGKAAVLKGDHIVFPTGASGDVEVHRGTLTRFRKKKNPNEHYTIDSLWFCAKNVGSSLAEYVFRPTDPY
jgi:hypothetical protein